MSNGIEKSETKECSTFERLAAINVNEHTNKKNKLTYLSWAWAWDRFKREMPDAKYTVFRDDQGRPYISDEALGYMVFVTVTAGGEENTMWLPVMDGANNSMKEAPYTYQVKEYKDRVWTKGYIDKQVDQATMFDVNKAIMRCLVKCLAMFGFAIYIYEDEDMPEPTEEDKENEATKKAEVESYNQLRKSLIDLEVRYKGVVAIALKDFDGVDRVNDLPVSERTVFLRQTEGLVIEHEKQLKPTE